MKLKWSRQALLSIQHNALYIQDMFGARAKIKFFSDISYIAKLLKDNSYLGRIEPLLDEASVAYRSITVNKLNKIIYYVNDDTIEIVDFWDTRMDPLQLSNRVSS